MRVGNVTSMNSMSSLQTAMAGSTDIKSKNIQKEITDKQQQMQKLSSMEELSADEKADERKKFQREISNLNTELERYQDEFLRSQKREIMMEELQKDEKPAEEGKSAGIMQTDEADKGNTAEKDTTITDSDMTEEPSNQDISAAASANTSAQQTGYQGTVIVKNSDGIVIFKGAMNQDEKYGVDAEQKPIDETDEEDIAKKGAKSIEDDMEIDTGLSHKEMNAMVSADVSMQQADHQGTVIARISGGIAILKGEMNQDEKRGENIDKKQAELEKLEDREEKARIFQFSVLGKANSTMRSSAETENSGTQVDIENNAFIHASKFAQEEQVSQQRFYVSIV